MKNKILILICLIFLISLSCVSASDINQTNTENVGNTILSTNNNVNVDNILSANENIDVNDNLSSYETYDIDNLTSDEGEFVDASEGYERLNAFRTENSVWQWNNDNTTRTVFNTNDTNQLKPLVRDTALEETAKIRAKELATKYSHTRPDGSSCWTAFPDGYWAKGENIAWGQRTWNQVTEAWKETEDLYDGQGHRRNMLNPNFNSVGVAGYKLNGVIYWAQDFGGKNNAEVLTKINPEDAFTIKNNTLKPEFNIQLPNNATGNFIVKIDGNVIDSKTLSNGKATITANDLSTGTHEAILSYGGDTNYYTVNQIVTINVTQNNPINPTPTDNSTGTFTDLNNLIQNSEENVIKLDKNYTYNNNTDYNLINGININKEITIDGQGFTIDGNNLAGIFNIGYTTVILKNIKLINGYADGGGGAIHGDGSISNCTFINNFASVYGGAIYGDCSVSNCTFINNSANTADTSTYSFGGAIYGDGSISNCIFINNSADVGGAILLYDGSISNCTFINNSDDKYGVSFKVDDNLTININRNVYDNITVQINNKKYSSQLKDNSTIINVDNIEFGKEYPVILTFVSDNNNTYIIWDKVTINNSAVNLSAQDVTKYYGGSERFIVTLKDKDNKAIVNETVNITINGRTYSRTTNGDGEASMAINLDSGEYDVLSQYKDYTVSSKVTIKSTISARDVTKIFRNGTQYYATFLDTKGNLLKNTAVGFNINGVFYTRYTNENGVARLNINLDPGTYLITATNPSSTEQHSNNITVLPSIVENHDLTKYYKNGSQYWVKILNDDGTAVGAGVSVSFNINGVFYTRTTNELGYVRLNINLDPNTYIITVMYNNLMVSNTIKVLPVLSANNLNMYYRDGSKFEAKLVDGRGNVLANQLITFNINGVFYDRMTNDNGIAMLNINLMPGKYIITSMYSDGASISNNVTIKLRLN